MGAATPIAQAGAVAVQLMAAPHFLLARSKQMAENWIFPKGHREPGEDDAATAVRELQEETGYDGRVVGRVGSIEYARGSLLMHVEYFLVLAGERSSHGDGREIVWLPYEEARRQLAHEDSRRVLDAAMRLLDSQRAAD